MIALDQFKINMLEVVIQLNWSCRFLDCTKLYFVKIGASEYALFLAIVHTLCNIEEKA